MSKDCNLLSLVDQCMEDFFQAHEGSMPNSGLFSRIIPEIEKKLIYKTLEYTKFNQSKSSKLLGINRNTLRKKIQEYNINVK